MNSILDFSLLRDRCPKGPKKIVLIRIANQNENCALKERAETGSNSKHDSDELTRIRVKDKSAEDKITKIIEK